MPLMCVQVEGACEGGGGGGGGGGAGGAVHFNTKTSIIILTLEY